MSRLDAKLDKLIGPKPPPFKWAKVKSVWEPPPRKCENPRCKEMRQPRFGGTLKLCGRCYQQKRRTGNLPGPKRAATSPQRLTVYLTNDEWLVITKRAGTTSLSSWVRELIRKELSR